jgi:hypothetical protein
MYRTEYRELPPRRRRRRRRCRATNKSDASALGLLRRRDSLSSVSSTFPAPTFTAASFSLSCAPPWGREEGTLSQVNARRSPGRRERESPVLQSRSGGPEGRSSVTLRTIPRSFTPFSLFLAILLVANSRLISQRLALPSSLRRRLPAAS